MKGSAAPPASNPGPRPGKRGLRAAWLVFGAGTFIGLLVLAGLSQRPGPWPEDPIAWWSADRMESRPLWPMRGVAVGSTKIEAVDGDPAAIVRSGSSDLSSFRLGRWWGEGRTWTWTFWVRYRVDPPLVAETLPAVNLARAEGPECQVKLIEDHGVFHVILNGWQRPRELQGEIRVPRPAGARHGEWLHLGITMTPAWLRLYGNGELLGENSLADPYGIQRAELRLEAEPLVSSGPQIEVLFDDSMVFDRTLSAPEIRSLANLGRGRLPVVLDRRALAGRIWRTGWPLVAAAFVALWLTSFTLALPKPVHALRGSISNPVYRPAWWLLVSGLLATLVLALVLARSAQANDQARFAKAAFDLKAATDIYFERIADLITRARDWIDAQTDLTPTSWDRWLASNHVPHDYVGLLGLGFAEYLPPGDVADHEARWVPHHGPGYRVQSPGAAGIGDSRSAGAPDPSQPHLPVVLFKPHQLDASLWRSNGTIFGLDLLATRPADPRVKPQAVRIREAIDEVALMSSDLEEIAPSSWYGETIQGLRLFTPLVRGTEGPPGRDPRAAANTNRCLGIVFANVDLRRWLEDMRDAPQMLGFRIYTGQSGRDRHQLALDSGDLFQDSHWRPNAYLTTELEIPLYHYRLWVDCWTTPTFESQSFRRWPWIVGVLGGGFTVLAAGLLFVQAAARERESAISQLLREANTGLSRAQQDRERLSRDIHDGTIQSLYAIGLHLQHAQRHQGPSSGRSSGGLEECQRLVHETIVELREFLLSLKGDLPISQTFEQIIRDLFERWRRTTSTEFLLTVDATSADLPAGFVVQLVQIVREAVSNALRHGHPSQLAVSLDRIQPLASAPEMRLEIRDNGRGFVTSEVRGDGYGLHTMRQRATELGGRFTLDSIPGNGTIILVVFPLPAAGPSTATTTDAVASDPSPGFTRPSS